MLYSPVSSSAADNYDRWVRGNTGLKDRVVHAFGTPLTNPGFWREASSPQLPRSGRRTHPDPSRHRFDAAWPVLMRRTVDFFTAQLARG